MLPHGVSQDEARQGELVGRTHSLIERCGRASLPMPRIKSNNRARIDTGCSLPLLATQARCPQLSARRCVTPVSNHRHTEWHPDSTPPAPSLTRERPPRRAKGAAFCDSTAPTAFSASVQFSRRRPMGHAPYTPNVPLPLNSQSKHAEGCRASPPKNAANRIMMSLSSRVNDYRCSSITSWILPGWKRAKRNSNLSLSI